MGGHKANKPVCECKDNSTVPHHAVRMLLGLAASAMSDLELHNYQTVFCSLLLNSPLPPYSDKATICISSFSSWTKIPGLAIIK